MEREGEAAADRFMGEAEGVGDPEDRTGHGIEELVEVSLVCEILALVVRARVEEAIGFIDDEELPLGVDHARDQLEDETAILETPLGEGDREEARHLADCLREGLRELSLAGAGHSIEQHIHGLVRGEETFQDAEVLLVNPEARKGIRRLAGRRRVGRV